MLKKDQYWRAYPYILQKTVFLSISHGADELEIPFINDALEIWSEPITTVNEFIKCVSPYISKAICLWENVFVDLQNATPSKNWVSHEACSVTKLD